MRPVLLAMLLALVAAGASALGPGGRIVVATGVVHVTNSGACDTAVVFHVDLSTATGLASYAPSTCVLFWEQVYDGSQCHEFCLGGCEDAGEGDVFCYFGDPEWPSKGTRLGADGTFLAWESDGWTATGTLTRAASP